MEIDIYKALFAMAVGVISWFLKGLISEVKAEVRALDTKVATNSTQIELLKNDHLNSTAKMEEISKDIKELSLYIRNLNKI